MTDAPPLILASTSRHRRALLARLQLPFTSEAPGVEESSHPGEAPPVRARRLALAKAQAVAVRLPQAIVIGSDQVAVHGTQVLDKPGNAERSRAHLHTLSGHEAHFHTAVAVVCIERRVAEEFIDLTTVRFRPLSTEEIARYVERERPYDCAGAFQSESLGVTLFERIESLDPTALVGLPLIRLAAVLRSLGYALP